MKTITPHNRLLAGILLSSLLASIGLLGGLGLQLVKRDILEFLPLLIALPAMNAIAGNYAALTAAHLSDPENYRKRTQKLILALLVSIPVCGVAIAGMSLGVAHLQGFDVSKALAIEYSRQICLTLLVVITLLFVIIFCSKAILTKKGFNVDDTLIPIANTIASVLMLLGFALLAARVL